MTTTFDGMARPGEGASAKGWTGGWRSRRVYELLDLRAVAQCDGGVELSGAVGDIDACVNQKQLHN
jgi:hypothetical protein